MIFAAAMVDYFLLEIGLILSTNISMKLYQVVNMQIYPDKIVAENTHADGGDGDTQVAIEEDDGADLGLLQKMMVIMVALMFLGRWYGSTQRIDNKKENDTINKMSPSPKQIWLQDNIVELQKKWKKGERVLTNQTKKQMHQAVIGLQARNACGSHS